MSKQPKSKQLRFGQEFCNRYNITDSELFYEQNDSRAKQIAYGKYLNQYLDWFFFRDSLYAPKQEGS